MKINATTVASTFLILLGLFGVFFAPNTYWLYVLGMAGIFSIVGYSLALLIGIAGQISIGHAAFFAIGAYTEAILTTKYGLTFWQTLPIGVVLAFVLGLILAAPALRVKGPYLAMVTIAFGLILENIIIEAESVTGGFNGISDIDKPSLFGFVFDMRWHVGLIILIAVITGFTYSFLTKLRFSKSLKASSDAEAAAISIGVNPVQIRSLAFAISAGITGLAGTLFAPVVGFISPENFNFFQSILFLLLTILGGVGTLTGPVIGAIIIAGLPEVLSGLAEYRILVFGILLVLILWVRPNGIASLYEKRMNTKKSNKPVEQGNVDQWLKSGLRKGLLKIENLSIRFGGVKAVSNVSFSIEPGKIVGLIGPNGAGKTTLLNLISGFYQAGNGYVSRSDENLSSYQTYQQAGLGIARTFQATQLFGSLTVYENLYIALPKGVEHDDIIYELLNLVGYKHELHCYASELAFVDRRLVEIARALACNPDLILLDEPAAGLSAKEKDDLSQLLGYLASLGVRILLVEHDVKLVMGTCDEIVVLDSGQVIAQGTPEQVREMPQVIEAYLGVAKLHVVPKTVNLNSKIVLEISNLSAGYGNLAVLKDINLVAKNHETLALLGANGAGKSTLMKALSGLIPSKGIIRFKGKDISAIPGHLRVSLGLALVPEGRQVFPELTVSENLLLGGYTKSAFIRKQRIEEMLTLFPRLRERFNQLAGTLSGGEQQMLAFGRAMMSAPDLLLLDEPSLGLAPKLVAEVYQAIQKIGGEGTGLMVVDQFAKTVLQIADRGYVFSSGKITLEGNAADLLQSEEMVSEYLGEG
jgi:ABC-type branched-subunit amino acid transport system ATPase component/ABC-type branched-subunit amino acid transport system permease subunit